MLVSGINFLVLGVLFGISGFLNNHRLWKYFPNFFYENKGMLILATMGLSIPLIARGILDIMRYYSTNFNAKVKKHELIYDTLLFVILDLVPLGF